DWPIFSGAWTLATTDVPSGVRKTRYAMTSLTLSAPIFCYRMTVIFAARYIAGLEIFYRPPTAFPVRRTFAGILPAEGCHQAGTSHLTMVQTSAQREEHCRARAAFPTEKEVSKARCNSSSLLPRYSRDRCRFGTCVSRIEMIDRRQKGVRVCRLRRARKDR